MDKSSFYRFERLIALQMGLQLRPRDRETLRGTLAARMAALRLRDADDYHRLLQAGTPAAESEWDLLTARLTNNESYFFRDKGQMALLRERILPELILRNQARRSLRLWSAGCSTGEEPYSLAILVDELLPQLGESSGSRWEIVILGTDIDEQALQLASRGIYGSWSFRTMEPAHKKRCFHRREGGWQVTESSRSIVTFGRCNLVADSFPSTATGIYEMDLILCRNVFIYFGREAISAVLTKFAQTLRAGGYLMTGHTEIQGQPIESLQVRTFPESVVYRRVGKASIGVATGARAAGSPIGTVGGHGIPAAHSQSPLPAPAASHASPASTPQATVVEHALADAEACYAARDYIAVIQTLRPLQEPTEDRVLVLCAHAHANLGHYEEASGCCRRLIERCAFASEPYELLASIAQEQRHYDEAKRLLKMALYLAPTSPFAYLELGALYLSEGDTVRARKMHVTALELLQTFAPETSVGAMGGPPAHEWVVHLEQMLAEE